MSSKTEKSIKNIVILFTHEIVALLCALIVPKFLLISYGSEYNGAISSISQLCSFIALLRMGVSGATRLALYKPLSENDYHKISVILMTTQKQMRRIAYVFVGYVGCLAVFYPLVVFEGQNFIDVSSLVIVTSIGTFAQYYFGLTYQILLTADQKHYVYSVVQIGTIILNAIVTVLLINSGFSIQIVKLGSGLIYCVSPMVLNVYVCRKYHVDKTAIPDDSVISQKKYVFMHSLANFVHENTDIVVLTFTTNPATVSIYTIYSLVMNGIKKCMTVFTTGLESAFGIMWVQNEDEAVNRNFRLFEYLISVFIVLTISCTINLIIPFISLYTKGVNDANYIQPTFALVITLAQGMYCLRTPYLTIVQACGRYRDTMNGASIEAALNLVISIALSFKYGLVGVAIGTFIANTFRTAQLSIYVYQHLLNKPIMALLRRFAWIIVSLLLTIWLQTVLLGEISTWSEWIKSGLIGIMIAAGTIVLLSGAFYREDVVLFVNKVKSVTKRKRKREIE